MTALFDADHYIDLVFLFEYDPVSKVSAVPLTSPKVLPEDFALQQNDSNPFNPDTMMVYNPPKGSYMDLDIYSDQGKKESKLKLVSSASAAKGSRAAATCGWLLQ